VRWGRVADASEVRKYHKIPVIRFEDQKLTSFSGLVVFQDEIEDFHCSLCTHPLLFLRYCQRSLKKISLFDRE
jgi:hypothetical protein